MRSSFAWICLVLCGLPAAAYAFDSLFMRVHVDSTLARIFLDSEAYADVEDGILIGTGTERVRHLPDGRLSVERTRRYTGVRRLDTHKIGKLPEPWEARSTVLLEPTLRLIQADTRTNFKRTGDATFEDYRLSEKHEWLFESDHTVIRALDGGKRLESQDWKQGKLVKSSKYDYPTNSAPLEVIGLYLTVAVQRGIDHFDFDLLVPGGDLHGIRSQVTRTRDVARFAKGYSVPKSRLVPGEPLAIVDMRLASPIKYVFFPHHFYMAFAEQQPDKLIMMWGGDPDENLQAFRREKP